ncbi:MAG: S8 family serine peptidase [Candidatus Jordarchaeaceae archaeon]
MSSLFAERRLLSCFLGLIVALIGLSFSELSQVLVSFPAFSYVSFSGRIVWSLLGFSIFLVGESLFLTSLVFLLLGRKIREAWEAQISKATLFTLASLILVQRVSGRTSFDGNFFGLTVYIENVYTDMTQYFILFSIIVTLSLVLASDFLLRREVAEKPSERFYLAAGLCNVALGIVMVASVLLKITNYSFYPLPNNIYFYTQNLLFSTVNAFEVLGVFSAALGCVVIAFKRKTPQIGRLQIVVGSFPFILAAPLTFTPIQIWMAQNVFNSPLLSSLNLAIVQEIFPLNFNFFTYISLIVFMIGMLVYLRISKLKMAVLIGFLVYLYLYPGLRFTFFYNNFPSLTPTIPLYIYAGLAVVIPVTAIPVVSQWNIFDAFRRISKPSKTAVLIIVTTTLLAYLLFMNSVIVATSPHSIQQIPVAQQKLSPDDKIDPRLLSIIPTGENIPVILRFGGPISNETETALNSSEFFTINGTYQDKCYYAIHGSINTTDMDSNQFKQTLRELVVNYTLSYILYWDPREPPNIESNYKYYYYVGADVLRAFNITGRGTTVAVIDSGINDYNKEIKEKQVGRVIYQVNFLTRQEGDPLKIGDVTPESYLLHGTNVAAVIAGARGIASEANIRDLKVKSESGELYYTTAIYTTEAIYWCIRNKDVFNISVIALALGNRDQYYGPLTEAVDTAFLNGIVVITAAGVVDFKKGSILGGIMNPGMADWGITVGATKDYTDDSWSPISPWGPSPHGFPKPEVVAAPFYTSTASSLVAGVAVLLAQQYNEAGLPLTLRASTIRWALIAGAQEYDLGSQGWDVQYGFGRVNALTSYLHLKNHLKL